MLHLPPETARAIAKAVSDGLAPLCAPPPMSLSRWAETAPFKLSAESSHTRGTWVPYPFQPGWMDAFSDDRIEEVTVRKSKRVGYTKTLLAFIGYNAAHRRRKQAIWQPTDDDRDSFVRTEIDPMLRDVAVMRSVQLGRNDDTLKLKTFVGSVLHTLGGKAARAYRRITVAVAMLDEASAFDPLVERSIDPIEGARGRLEGAAFPKLIAGSTPRIKGADHIETREQAADAVLRYHITCPHCGLEHPLAWGSAKVRHGFKWDGDDPATVRHHCQHCLEPITQHTYLTLYHAGTWISQCGRWRYGQDRTWRNADGAECDPPRHVAFTIWAAYSPQRTWTDIVREFIQAVSKARTGEIGPLMTWRNETEGELWETKLERADEHELSRRAEPYARYTVPAGGLELVCGIDTQDDRWEAVTWAFGRGCEMWCVDYSVIYGNPADEQDWHDKLDPYLDTVFEHAVSGASMRISATGLDTGGHHTHQAYNWARRRESRNVYALKGDNTASKPIKGKASIQDVNWRGQILKRGVRLWHVGVDTAKDLLHGRLSVQQPGPGRVHFYSDLPPSFYSGLTAESRVPQRVGGGVAYRWVNVGRKRNEPLDCTVYALFAAEARGLSQRTETEWQRIEYLICPPMGDLFGADHAATAAAATVRQLQARAAKRASPPGIAPAVQVPQQAQRPAFGRAW